MGTLDSCVLSTFISFAVWAQDKLPPGSVITLELLGIWEQLNNSDFNPVEFDGIKKQAGLNSFTLTPKQWIEKTVAIGIVSKAGRYGGTYAHKDRLRIRILDLRRI